MNDIENPRNIASEMFFEIENKFIEKDRQLESFGFDHIEIQKIIKEAKLLLIGMLHEIFDREIPQWIGTTSIITNDKWVENLMIQLKKEETEK